MKPAVCLLCGKAAIDETGSSKGSWLQFAEYAEASTDSLNHPEGLEYFCDEHLAAAQALTSRPSKEALAELQRRFGITSTQTLEKPHRPQSWWRRLIGSHE